MKYGLAADLHFHKWSAFSQATTGAGATGNSRLDGLLSELHRLAAETMAAGGTKVILAGDIFHVRGSVSPTVLNAVKDMIHTCLKTMDIEFIILAGNHDLEGKDSTRLGSAVTALEQPGVRVVNEPLYLPDDRLMLVPWHEKVEDLKDELLKQAESLDGLTRLQTDLILHAPIDGVIEGLPAHGLTGEWLAALGFGRVFAGHYHNHKLVYEDVTRRADGPTTGTVWSIGALAHHTWSDVGTKAGFLLVDDSSVTWRASRLPSFVDLGDFAGTEEELEFAVDRNFVRLKVESDTSKAVIAAREELTTMGALGVLIQATPKPPPRTDETGAVRTGVTGLSLEASIGEFTKSMADTTKAGLVLTAALACLSAADSVEAA